MTFFPDKLIISSLQENQNSIAEQISAIWDNLNQTAQPTTINVPQAVNQIYNGSFTHSVGSWANSATADNRRYECHNWYSHPTLTNQPMYLNTTASGMATVTFTNTDIGTDPSNEITVTNHGLYTGIAVRFTRSAPPSPEGLVDGTIYFVIYVDENTIKLASSAANALAGTPVIITTTGDAVTYTLSFNYTLKTDDHTYYSEAYGDWSWTAPSAGCGRFQGSTSLDVIIPGNNIEPGYTFYGAFDIVKLNQYVTASSEERIWCGLYAKQDTTWDWIQGDFTITAEVLNNDLIDPVVPADYRIVANTDRGFTVLSDVVSVPDAPSDADFNAGARVFLSWKNVLTYGVQTYDIYRFRDGAYELLQTVTTGLTQTLDNNSVSASAVGWPSGTFNKLVAYTATIPNVIDQLPYSGDPINPFWATIPFTLKVPQNYDMSTTDLSLGQWLRWGFSGITGNLDLDIPDGIITDTSTTITTASSGQFRADQVGLDIDIYISDDSFIGTTIATYVGPNEITVADPMTDTATDVRIYIHEGAEPHSLFVDLAHLTYIQGAAFSPAAADISEDRGLPPVTPNGTTQGGSGQGQPPGGVDGQPVCLYEEELVETSGGTIPAKDLRLGMKLPDGEGGLNTIFEVKWGIDDIWLIETANGVTLKATSTKQVFTPDGKKTLANLEKGDTIITVLNNVKHESKIILKIKLLVRQMVVQIGLQPNEKFLAGGGTGYVQVSNRKPVLIGGDGTYIPST